MNAGIVARLSNEDRGDSLEAQVTECRSWTGAKGYTVAAQHVWIENDVSGSLSPVDRPVLKRALGALSSGQVQVLVLRDLDRLGRRLDTAQLIEEHQRYGDGIQFVHQPRIDDPLAQVMATGMLATFATYERMAIAERTAAGRRRKLEKGGYAGGAPPHWLAWDGKDWTLLEPESTRVREMVRRYLAGEGSEQLTKLFAGDPLGPHQRKQARGFTSDTAVIRMLSNPALVGRMYWRSPVVRRGRSVSTEERRQALKRIALAASLGEADRMAEEHGLVAVTVPALIDFPTYAAVQRKRVRSFHAPLRDNSTWLLQGRIRCGKCGYAYMCRPSGGRGGQRWYRDRGRLRYKMHGKDLCDGPPLLADRIEAEIAGLLERSLAEPQLLKRAGAEYLSTIETRLFELEQQTGNVDEQLTALQEKRERFASLYGEGDIGKERWHSERDKIDKDIQALAVQAGQHREALAELKRTRSKADELKRLLDSTRLVEEIIASIGTKTRSEQFGASIVLEDGKPVMYPRVSTRYTLADLVSLLDVRLTVHDDGVHIDAALPLEGAGATALGRGLG
jgi:DNA invertase Pin-like site-specific DNA recombinase